MSNFAWILLANLSEIQPAFYYSLLATSTARWSWPKFASLCSTSSLTRLIYRLSFSISYFGVLSFR
jgi:hypothetical protein